MTYYEALQVRENAAAEEIRTAYLRLVQQYHPDRHVGDAASLGSRDQERFKQIQEAYEVLYDADRRLDYDRRRMAIPQPRPDRRRQAVVTPVARQQRRDIPNDWLYRRSPRKRKKLPTRKLIYLSVLVAMLVTVVVPQCGRVLESKFDQMEKFESASGTSMRTPDYENVQVPPSVRDAIVRLSAQQHSTTASPPLASELEQGNEESQSKSLVPGDKHQPQAAPPDATVDWLTAEKRDWAKKISASAEDNSSGLEEAIESMHRRSHQVFWNTEPDDVAVRRAVFEVPAQAPPMFAPSSGANFGSRTWSPLPRTRPDPVSASSRLRDDVAESQSQQLLPPAWKISADIPTVKTQPWSAAIPSPYEVTRPGTGLTDSYSRRLESRSTFESTLPSTSSWQPRHATSPPQDFFDSSLSLTPP